MRALKGEARAVEKGEQSLWEDEMEPERSTAQSLAGNLGMMWVCQWAFSKDRARANSLGKGWAMLKAPPRAAAKEKLKVELWEARSAHLKYDQRLSR